MAGDWIPMRCDLATDPAVISISETLQIEEDLVVGKLHKLWSWADQQTEDGNAVGVTLAWLNRYVCVEGFAEAMKEAGWLVVGNRGISLPKFEVYNGKSGKKRLLTARRQATHRSRKRNAPDVTSASPTEQNNTVHLSPSSGSTAEEVEAIDKRSREISVSVVRMSDSTHGGNAFAGIVKTHILAGVLTADQIESVLLSKAHLLRDKPPTYAGKILEGTKPEDLTKVTGEDPVAVYTKPKAFPNE